MFFSNSCTSVTINFVAQECDARARGLLERFQVAGGLNTAVVLDLTAAVAYDGECAELISVCVCQSVAASQV